MTRAPSPAQSFLSSRSRSSSRSYTPRRRSSSPTESLSSWCYIPPYEPSQTPEVSPSEIAKPGRGLYIQFANSFPTSEAPPSYSSRPEPIRRKSTITRLRRTITTAVQDAGMESPTATDKQNPLDSKDLSQSTQRRSSKSLFRGTYGQVMSALKDAGLMITPCTEAGFEEGMWEPRDTHEERIRPNFSVCVPSVQQRDLGRFLSWDPTRMEE
jgi:hypothetical protein